MKKCPFCRGNKGATCHVNTGLDSSKHYWKWFDCEQCGGTGEVTEKHYNHVIAARLKRVERSERNETLLDCAKRLGISVAELSAIESGRDYKEVN